MPHKAIDKNIRKAVLNARRMIQQAEKADCNEAETRRRIERIFESLMGYDVFKHLSRERAVRGPGETEHVDFSIQIEEGEDDSPIMMVEIKRVNINLAPKHLRQAASYAINEGCEWILLTNSREWRLYHVSFGQPPVTKMIKSWNILSDGVPILAKQFKLISLKSVKKGTLDKLWQKTNVLHPRNLLQAILSEGSIRYLKRNLRRDSGVALSPEDIISGVRRLLNEAALAELETMRISLPERKTRRRKSRSKVATTKKQEEQEISNDPAGPTGKGEKYQGLN